MTIHSVLLEITLERDATKAVKWFLDNQMQANPEKFQVMLVSHRESDFSVNICGAEVKSQKSVEILGVVLDNKLKYDKMINEVWRHARGQINFPYRLRNKLDYDSRLQIYDSFFTSNMSYCQVVWTHCSVAGRRRLEKLNERALKFVNNDFVSPYEEQIVNAKRSSLLVTRIKAMGIEMFKVNNRLSPTYINELFSQEFCTYTLRAKNTFYLPRFSTFGHGYHSFSYLGVKIWNAFTNDMRMCTDIKEFKVMLNNWLCNNNIMQFS